MSCITCCRLWTVADFEADDDEIRRESIRRESITAHLKEGGKGDPAKKSAKAVASPSQITPAGSPTEEEESTAAAPASGDTGAVASPDATQGGALKRVEQDLIEGGLLLTQVKRERSTIRRLYLDGEKAILKWETEVLFGKRWIEVKLSEARIMSTGNLVKIGVAGKKEFMTFEACDEAEAVAVCDALVARAKAP